MRIFKNRHYVMSVIPGISGFQRWEERAFCVITGHKAANHRTDIVGEWTPTADETYRLCDGHLPECQPTAKSGGVIAFLTQEPYQCATAIGHTAQKYCSRYTPGKIPARDLNV